jgi:glycosyltransferase involved in cell wall biosynthesis
MEKTKDKNILYLVHRYSDFQKDQIEILSKRFNHVYVIMRYKPIAEITTRIGIKSFAMHGLKYALQKKGLPENVSVFIAPLFYLPTNWGYRALGEKHYQLSLKIIKNNNLEFDIIHSHFAWSAGYVGMKLKDKFSKPFVLTTHGYDIYDLPFRSKIWKPLIKKVIESADINITGNKKNLDWYEKIGVGDQKKINVIPNGYNNQLFHPVSQNKARSKLMLSQDSRIILTVGNIVSVKGHEYLVDAMSKMELPNVQCIVIGEGSKRKKMVKKVKSLGLAEKIIFLGPMMHHELNLWMNACDVFVLPSISETFGIVQLEAMACGKPVVATINGGSECLIVNDDLGFLCIRKDSEDLSIKMMKAFSKKWDANKIIMYANRFSWQEICEKIYQTYAEILDCNTKEPLRR